MTARLLKERQRGIGTLDLSAYLSAGERGKVTGNTQSLAKVKVA